jgi:hypothetical protein
MNTHNFISLASVLIACWLGATFFTDVPAERYPYSSTAGADSAATYSPVDTRPKPVPDSKTIVSLSR